MPNILAFVSYALITTFTPGPNNIMSMTYASRYGFRKSIRFNVGVFFGFFVIMGLCTLFSTTLYNLFPDFKPYMLAIGTIYILYLAYKTFTSHPSDMTNDSKINTFIAGFLLQFINPKVILYGITTLSTFVIPHGFSVSVLIAFSFGLALLGFVATCCWAFFGAVFQLYLLKKARIVNTIMALLLVYCAVSLFL